MKGKCLLPDCGLKDGLACEIGHLDFTKCPKFEAVADTATDQIQGVVDDDGSGQRLPWTGRAMGLSDMMLVSARSSSSLVGLIGPFNAGKTSFLTSLFAHFSKTGTVSNFSFAGSYTIDAWDRLRQHTEWPAAHDPSFPPHTPDTADRVPSLLHLAFREGTELVRDLLFTDAPGEWFTNWVRNQSAEDARGARWIAEYASHFLFFVDRSALAGADVGKARQNTLTLARVLSEHRRDQPIAVIWTKSDEKYDENVEAPIREKLERLFGPHSSWNLDAEDPACLEILSQLLAPPKPSAVLEETQTSVRNRSAFMSFTGTTK
jgi:hypothetical protein